MITGYDVLGMVYFFLLIVLIVYLVMRRQPQKQEEPDNDFAYLTVREQLAAASQTADMIAEAEQLIADMEESNADDILVLHIEWLGRDDQMHELSLNCDGINTATACMTEIGEREINDLKNDLAQQCAVLSEHGRSRQNRRHYGRNPEGEGSESIDEVVSTLRSSYLNG